jgi:hypothetical protein
MPTIDDLNAAFAQLERGAPTEIADVPGPTTSNVELVHALARTNRRPRRALTAIGGAVAVAATVTAIVTASSIGHGRHSPTAGANSISAAGSPSVSASSASSASSAPLPLLATPHFAAHTLPAGLSVYTDYATPLLQQVDLSRTGDSAAVDLLFSNASNWQPTIPADAVAVSVNGVPGYYSPAFDLSKAPAGGEIPAGIAPGIVWQPAAGYWAFATQLGTFGDGHTQLSQQEFVATATAVYSDGPWSATVSPVKFGYLPVGLVLFDAGIIYRGPGDVDVRFDLGLPSGDSRGSLSIEIETTSIHDPGDNPVNGFSGSYDPTLVRVSNGKVEISLGGSADAPITTAEATQILQSVTVAANLKSTAGWFPLATALP